MGDALLIYISYNINEKFILCIVKIKRFCLIMRYLNKEENQIANNNKTNYVGGGIGVGAALGIIFGLLLESNISFSIIIGASIGLIVGAIWDANYKNKD